MGIDNLLAGVIVNLVSSVVLWLVAYVFGYKKLNKKIDKLNNEIIKIKTQSTNQVSQTYERLLKEYNQELDEINKQLKNNEELFFSTENNTEEDYHMYLQFQYDLENEKEELIKKIKEVTNEYFEISNKIKSN